MWKDRTTKQRTAAETLEISYSRRLIGGGAGARYTCTSSGGERLTSAEAGGIRPRKNNQIRTSILEDAGIK